MRRAKRLGGSGWVCRSSYITASGLPSWWFGGFGIARDPRRLPWLGWARLRRFGEFDRTRFFFEWWQSHRCSFEWSAAHFGHSCSDQLLDEPHRHWFRERQPDGPLRHFVALQILRQRTPDRTGHRKQAAMALEGSVPDERATVELEGGNPIAERFFRAGRDGANGGPNSPQSCSRLRGRRREVGSDFRFQLRPPRYGRLNATYASLDFDPNLPPPAATTTNCLPPAANVLGVA